MEAIFDTTDYSRYRLVLNDEEMNQTTTVFHGGEIAIFMEGQWCVATTNNNNNNKGTIKTYNSNNYTQMAFNFLIVDESKYYIG